MPKLVLFVNDRYYTLSHWVFNLMKTNNLYIFGQFYHLLVNQPNSKPPGSVSERRVFNL